MKNHLYYGDNWEVMRSYIDAESIDLCYIDPPFNSKRNYNQIYNNLGKEDVAQAHAFTDTWTWNDLAIEDFSKIDGNYEKRFSTQTIYLIRGLEKVLERGSLLAYLVNMTLRIVEIHRVLKPTGTFYLHCDPTASHYLKLICDSVFCAKGGDFKNELIWSYETGGIPRKDFSRKHDIIFRYTKSNHYYFNPKEIMEKRSDEVLRRIATGVPTATRSKGEFRHPSDVLRIPSINAMAKERLGYPTQKPEKLLETIILASTQENEIVLDAYCGCGTTIAVAQKLNRNWMGIDITYQSISLVLKRLSESGYDIAEIDLTGIPRDFESAKALANKKDDRIRKEFEKWIVLTFSNNEAIVIEKDHGRDGIAFIKDVENKGTNEEKIVDKEVFFQAKSNITLNPSVIRDLYGTITRDGAVKGYLLSLYPMPNLVRESKRYGLYENGLVSSHKSPVIEVINVQEIIDGKRMYLPASQEALKKAKVKYQPEQFDFGL